MWKIIYILFKIVLIVIKIICIPFILIGYLLDKFDTFLDNINFYIINKIRKK